MKERSMTPIKMPPQQAPEVSYEDFVNGLFVKPGTPEERLAHAAMGMVGEAVELKYANSWENLVEELGDFEFYSQAWKNTLKLFSCYNQGVLPQRYWIPDDGNEARDVLIRASTELMDLAKKVWIYSKPVSVEMCLEFINHMTSIRMCVTAIYGAESLTQDQVIAANRAKLAKRYAGAVYTDAAAQARADKAEEPAQADHS